ncbi:MAG: M48 family metalloprotease [Pseudomonadales bacterium]|nr:M48 family metalloprotease [Pseudomonadales bacterium]
MISRLKPPIRSLLLLYFVLASYAPSTWGAANPTQPKEPNLPYLGDASSAIVSPQQEYWLGRAWLRQFRRQVSTLDDPLISHYLEKLVYRLVPGSGLGNWPLELVVVDNSDLNAFAAPGGVLGINTGTLRYAETEGELASIIAHELAHISQRHFARGVEEAKSNQVPALAAMLASILLIATTGGDAGFAALASTQAVMQQQYLRFSRKNEAEADRLGLVTLMKANYDPLAMPTMFERMLRAKRYSGQNPSEFLLTHPLTESRIADTRNRAEQYANSPSLKRDTLQYQLIRNRIQTISERSPGKLIKYFKAKLAEGLSPYHDADRYGLLLAYTKAEQYQEARELLKELLNSSSDKLEYLMAQSEIELQTGNTEEAVALLKKQLELQPEYYPLEMQLAKAYRLNGDPKASAEIIESITKNRTEDPYVWFELAEARGLADDKLGVHRARAEFFQLVGNFSQAKKQLQFALQMTGQQFALSSAIEQRIVEITRIEYTSRDAMKSL